MRPTIPLGPWRLAIDLVATRAVNALAVAYQQSLAPAPPAWATAEYQPLIAIDFWFTGPRGQATRDAIGS